jgi:hypothetical protein
MAHKNAPHEVNYEDTILEQVASTGIHGRVIQRAEDSKLTVQTGNKLVISPDMIAGGYDIDSGIEEFFCRTGSQPQTASRVLTIAYDEVDIMFAAQGRQDFLYCVSAGLADDVAYCQYLQVYLA